MGLWVGGLVVWVGWRVGEFFADWWIGYRGVSIQVDDLTCISG